MTVTVRFAPSPTGLLHVGNARVALINWLFAKSQGGYFVLRLDDTDLERSRPEFEVAIREDLTWLGLAWDRKLYQSRRLDRYELAAERLKAEGRLYACYETPEELEAKRKAQLERGKPPVYDRAGLSLSDAQRQAYEADGRRPHWRFKLERTEVRWDDLVRGASAYHGGNLSDPILIRADGTFLYTLTSVVDDLEVGISHVIRGEDHVTNTAVQIQIFRALGGEPPAFAHLPLLTGADGQGLSKRLGSGSLRDLRSAGVEPLALTSLLAKLGTSDPVQLRDSLDALVDEFDLAKVNRATCRFDEAELRGLNQKLLHSMSFEQAEPRLAAAGLGQVDLALWEAVRGNLDRIEDAGTWWAVVREEIEPELVEPDYTALAVGLLPPGPWDQSTWGAFTAAVKAATGRKGKELFHPLRLALTGRSDGPELKLLLPLIGPERAKKRLSGERG